MCNQFNLKEDSTARKKRFLGKLTERNVCQCLKACFFVCVCGHFLVGNENPPLFKIFIGIKNWMYYENLNRRKLHTSISRKKTLNISSYTEIYYRRIIFMNFWISDILLCYGKQLAGLNDLLKQKKTLYYERKS